MDAIVHSSNTAFFPFLGLTIAICGAGENSTLIKKKFFYIIIFNGLFGLNRNMREFDRVKPR